MIKGQLLSGITKEGLAKLEQPGADPKLSTLRELAKALGVSIAELVGEEEKPKPRRGK